MWSQTKSSGTKWLEAHDVSNNLDSNTQAEKQNIRPLKVYEISQEKPRIGQGDAGMKRGMSPIKQTNASEVSKKISELSKIEKKVITHPDFTTTE